jgi:hypothetical protein
MMDVRMSLKAEELFGCKADSAAAPSMPLSPIIRQAKVDSRQEKWVGQ